MYIYIHLCKHIAVGNQIYLHLHNGAAAGKQDTTYRLYGQRSCVRGEGCLNRATSYSMYVYVHLCADIAVGDQIYLHIHNGAAAGRQDTT